MPLIRERHSGETMTDPSPLLDVQNLSVAFTQGGKTTLAVDHVSFSIGRGETLALVGESGSGKSVSALSILRLLNYPAASHPSGTVHFKGKDLLTASDDALRAVRGNDITIVFQEPMTSLNPLHTIEKQIGEILWLHRGLTGAEARTTHARTLAEGRLAGCGKPAGGLSAPALRRTAPARDDRHGARQ